MTNPYIAGAAGERYLTDLFDQYSTEPDSKGLAEHVIENVRRGEDGYPVLKIVGKNRLVMEFDLSVPPIGPKATAQAKQLVNAPAVPMTGEAFAAFATMGGEETIKPTDPKQVEHPEAGLVDRELGGAVYEDDPGDGLAEIRPDDRPMDPSHPDWPNRPLRHEDDVAPAEDLPHDQGYRSPWAEKGDAARAKQELPSDPTEADLPAPLDQESITAGDAAGSSN